MDWFGGLEPTSALDEGTMKKVERSLMGMLPPLRNRTVSVSLVKGGSELTSSV